MAKPQYYEKITPNGNRFYQVIHNTDTIYGGQYRNPTSIVYPYNNYIGGSYNINGRRVVTPEYQRLRRSWGEQPGIITKRLYESPFLHGTSTPQGAVKKNNELHN